MINYLRQISVQAKLRALTLLPIGMILLLCLYTTWNSYQIRLAERENSLRQAVESVMSSIEWAHRQELSGAMTPQEAKAAAISAVSSARYNGKEYFWINDLNARIVDHPIKKEYNGKDMRNFTDPDGVKMFVEFAKTAADSADHQGVVRYRWPRPGSEEPVQKLSFVKAFMPWGWVVGTGVYIDDLRNALMHDLMVLAATVASCLAITLAAAKLIGSVLNKGIAKAVRVANAIAQGDISQEFQIKGRDEIAQLLRAMNGMSTHLRTTISDVRAAADQLAQASEQIAAGNTDLSGRTELTASRLQETSAAMAELTSSVRHSAESAHSASDHVQAANRIATQGGEVTQRVVATMGDIDRHANKIADIISVIDGIAFQTNILALNAAVEAARAGEQGRGFAVVAAEVRNLAQRSANAAKEIKSLITSSVESVHSGSTLVSDAGATMGEIVSAVNQVRSIVSQISQESSIQSEGIIKMHETIASLDQMTQQNAALVEESAAAAESLHDQARRLADVVSRFKIQPHQVY